MQTRSRTTDIVVDEDDAAESDNEGTTPMPSDLYAKVSCNMSAVQIRCSDPGSPVHGRVQVPRC